MAVSSSFIDFAKETFAPFGEISVRKMFGGAGIYCDGLFFAILDDEAVYLKVDDETRRDFERAGLAPFSFEMKTGERATMSYYGVPDAIFDDEEELKKWTRLALDAARRASRLKPKKRAPSRGKPRSKSPARR